MTSPSPPSLSSETAGPETQLSSSSSSPRPPHLSLQSPELQAEFLKECRNRSLSQSVFSDSSTVYTPSSPLSSSSSPWSSSSSSLSPGWDSRRAHLSLSSPELLSELKKSRTRPLRHVPTHNGLTTVFSGRGQGQASDSAPIAKPANQRISR